MVSCDFDLKRKMTVQVTVSRVSRLAPPSHLPIRDLAKFTPRTIANGRVYVAAATFSNKVVVYELLS
jgi:hypothetical protein